MKKLFTVLLAVLLVVGTLPMAALADERLTGGTLGSLTWEITLNDMGGMVLTIGGSGSIPDYGYPDFDDLSTLPPWPYFTGGKGAPAAAMIIEPGVTAIGDYAFYVQGCMSLSIPNTVTSIGEDAFSDSGCGHDQNTQPMESLDIPGSVKEIKGAAFAGFGTKKIILHEGTTTLGYMAIARSASLEAIYLPKSLTNVDFVEVGPGGDDSYRSGLDMLKDIYYAGSEADAKANRLDLYFEWLGNSNAQVHYNTPAPGDTPPTPSKPTVGGFTDVYEGEYYADAVVWAVNKGITSGKGNGKFSPSGQCTRAEVVTFLWRATGKPTVSGETFSDVPAGAYYEDAVKWAVKEGITSGTGDGKFNPGGICNRAQAVTFLWRANGKPTSSGTAFSDVSSGSYYADAVKWAVSEEVASGTGGGKFSPTNNCTRGQIVTFLHRAEN